MCENDYRNVIVAVVDEDESDNNDQEYLINDQKHLIKCSVCKTALSTEEGKCHRHYGANNVCQSCAAFFRYTLCNACVYTCEGPKQCELFLKEPTFWRSACRSCRLEKCRRVGMRENMVRSLPYHLMKKRRTKKALTSNHENDGTIIKENMTKNNYLGDGTKQLADFVNLPPQSSNKETNSNSNFSNVNSNSAAFDGDDGSACVICGQFTHHRHYNAVTCFACRSFFKRSALSMKRYRCLEGDGKCILDEKNGILCRACRMDKCILAGMDVNAMRLAEGEKKRVNDFLKKQLHALTTNSSSSSPEIQYQKQQQQQKIETWTNNVSQQLTTEFCETNSSIFSMIFVEEKLRKFFTVERSFKMGYLEQFDNIAQMLLNNGGSVLCNFEKFTEILPELSNEQKYELSARYGNLYTRPKSLIMEMCSIVDLFRTMPVSQMLDIKDQAILINYVMLPQVELFNKFTSSVRNSPVVLKMATGCDLWHVFCGSNGIYADDMKVRKLGDQIFRLAVQPFARIQLRLEEYLMLRSILFCHFAILGLSPQGQIVLEQESEKYTRMLTQWLRCNYGEQQFAQRFADILYLAACVLRSADKLRELFTHLATVSDPQRFQASIPPVFVPLCLREDQLQQQQQMVDQ